MNTQSASSASLHPVLWIAGIAVTLLSIIGIAFLTGMLPSHTTPTTAAAVSVPAAVSPPSPATAPVPVAPPPVAASVPVAPQPKVARKRAGPQGTSPVVAVPPPGGTGAPPDYVPAPATKVQSPPLPCVACGVVSDIRQLAHEGEGTGLGAIGGGLIGGVLGNSVGRGDGRTLATLAGVVGGSLLGNKLEQKQRQTVAYRIDVSMEDGTVQVIETSALPSWRVGDRVKLVDGNIAAR